MAIFIRNAPSFLVASPEIAPLPIASGSQGLEHHDGHQPVMSGHGGTAGGDGIDLCKI